MGHLPKLGKPNSECGHAPSRFARSHLRELPYGPRIKESALGYARRSAVGYMRMSAVGLISEAQGQVTPEGQR